jgi:hypothetical protein
MKTAQPETIEALRLLASELTTLRPTGEPFRRPELVEAAASAVAAAVRDVRPDLILTWDSLDDGILAHGIARELGIHTTLVHEPREGIVEIIPTIVPGSRVVLFACSFDRTNTVRAPASLIGHQGGVLVLVVSIVATPITRDEVPLGVEYLVIAD